MIGLAIVALLSQPTLQPLLAGRVYPVRLPPEPQLPAVAYQIVSEQRGQRPRRSSGTVRSLVQLSVVAVSYDDAQALAKAIRQAIGRKRGLYGGIDIRDVLDQGAHDDPGDNSPQLLAMTWAIHWREVT